MKPSAPVAAKFKSPHHGLFILRMCVRQSSVRTASSSMMYWHHCDIRAPRKAIEGVQATEPAQMSFCRTVMITAPPDAGESYPTNCSEHARGYRFLIPWTASPSIGTLPTVDQGQPARGISHAIIQKLKLSQLVKKTQGARRSKIIGDITC